MGRGERAIEACNSKSSIPPGLSRFFCDICFRFILPFPYDSGSASSFSFCPLWFVFFGGVFSYYIRISCLVHSQQSCPGLLLPRFLFPFWQIGLSAHFLLLRSLPTNLISRFLPNSAISTLLFSFLSNSPVLFMSTGLVGVSCFFLNKKIWWLLSFFPFALLNTISNFQARFSSVQFSSVFLPLRVLYIYRYLDPPSLRLSPS